jgi:hypothetical protein
MIKVSIPTLVDSTGKEISGLFETLRNICFFAVSYDEIIKVGTEANRPTTGRRVFYYATDSKQWYAYTGNATVGMNGWVMFG